jgi:acyl-CoA reductase-like NAD-dependent aldehyde dehydrogenase
MALQTIHSPFDGSPVGEVELASPASTAAAVATAGAAFPAWSRRSPGQRAALLEKAAGLLAAREAELAPLLARESGKILGQSEMEIRFSADLLKGNAEIGRRLSGELLPTGALDFTAHDLGWVRRVPLGVIAAILPFNFPVELLIEKAGAALVAGNTVIVKPPEQNPLAVLQAVAAFHAAGVPADVLQVVCGGREIGAALASSPGIAAISLTGSTRAGVAAAQQAAPALRRLHLELGGNDAAIILEDADLDLVVDEIVPGRILMNGQSCAANKRLIVHQSLARVLAERLAARVANLRVGDPLDRQNHLGPLISSDAAARVRQQILRAIDQGARLVAGDVKMRGAEIGVHLLDQIPSSADIAMDDEIFGPVFALIPVASDHAALEVANRSSFGLSGCVFSRDTARALAVADRLESGGVIINGSGNYRPPIVPFGGVKLSGIGREGLGYTIDDLTQPKYTVLRRFRREVAGEN